MSDEPKNVDLTFLGRAVERLTGEIMSMREDINVLTSLVLRMDNTQTALLGELRAIHSQQQRMNNRLRAVEDKVN